MQRVARFDWTRNQKVILHSAMKPTFESDSVMNEVVNRLWGCRVKVAYSSRNASNISEHEMVVHRKSQGRPAKRAARDREWAKPITASGNQTTINCR